MNKRPFLLRILNKLDNYLLLYKPEIWSARAHLVKWYSLLFMVVLAGLCFFNYNDARLTSNVSIWVGFVAVIAILALVTWVIYLLRFNVFKRYGNIKPVGRLTTFLLYFIAAGFIVAYSFIPLIVETLRAQDDYNNTELVNDINAINTKICQLEYNSLPKIWNRDTAVIVDSIPGGGDDSRQNDLTSTDGTTLYRYLITRERLQQIISEKDSIQKLNDSSYILFDIPDFAFLGSYNYMPDDSDQLILTSQMIYTNTLQHFSPPDKTKTSNELNTLLSKYYLSENESRFSANDEDNSNRSYTTRINTKYKLNAVGTGINNISNKINRFNDENGATCFRIWFYFSFAIALLLFIFRHSTVRTFFFSLLCLIILFIISSLITSFIGGAGIAFFIWCFFYVLLFSILSALVFSNETRSIITGISINLWMLFVPFIPLLITGYYYEYKHEHDMVKNIITLDYETMQRNMLIAEITGPIIFCILLFTYIHRLYKRWYALPEQ